jgi:hypothetical protein
MIKDLVANGELMEAQAIILDELESQFGGAAEAAGGPFKKALGQLSNVWGDLLEEMGFAFVENEAFIELINQMKAIVISWIPIVGNLVDTFIDWIGPADELEGKLDKLFTTVQVLIAPFKALAIAMNAVGSWVANDIHAVKQLFTSDPDTSNWVTDPSFKSGTGPAGLLSDGPVNAHKGEIILNPAESEAYRNGGGGGGISITIAPTFMSGDSSAARAVAVEIQRELTALNHRWGA